MCQENCVSDQKSDHTAERLYNFEQDALSPTVNEQYCLVDSNC